MIESLKDASGAGKTVFFQKHGFMSPWDVLADFASNNPILYADTAAIGRSNSREALAAAILHITTSDAYIVCKHANDPRFANTQFTNTTTPMFTLTQTNQGNTVNVNPRFPIPPYPSIKGFRSNENLKGFSQGDRNIVNLSPDFSAEWADNMIGGVGGFLSSLRNRFGRVEGRSLNIYPIYAAHADYDGTDTKILSFMPEIVGPAGLYHDVLVPSDAAFGADPAFVIVTLGDPVENQMDVLSTHCIDPDAGTIMVFANSHMYVTGAIFERDYCPCFGNGEGAPVVPDKLDSLPAEFENVDTDESRNRAAFFRNFDRVHSLYSYGMVYSCNALQFACMPQRRFIDSITALGFLGQGKGLPNGGDSDVTDAIAVTNNRKCVVARAPFLKINSDRDFFDSIDWAPASDGLSFRLLQQPPKNYNGREANPKLAVHNDANYYFVGLFATTRDTHRVAGRRAGYIPYVLGGYVFSEDYAVDVIKLMHHRSTTLRNRMLNAWYGKAPVYEDLDYFGPTALPAAERVIPAPNPELNAANQPDYFQGVHRVRINYPNQAQIADVEGMRSSQATKCRMLLTHIRLMYPNAVISELGHSDHPEVSLTGATGPNGTPNGLISILSWFQDVAATEAANDASSITSMQTFEREVLAQLTNSRGGAYQLQDGNGVKIAAGA
jgi:hypothetical protein